MSARSLLGKAGETMACDLFRRLGFDVVEKNFRCDAGEIDVVAMRGRLVVFCEVKTRRSARWGAPSEAVNPVKQARIRRIAAMWLSERRVKAVEIRFDVVSVVVDGGGARVEHLPGAF